MTQRAIAIYDREMVLPFPRSFALLSALTALLVAPPARAADPAAVTLYYYDRPPYYVIGADDTVSGLAIVPTRAAFERAGIPYVLECSSVQRIFEMMRNERGLFCSPGWYRTEERTQFAKFTRPILHDKPTIGIARKGFAVPPGTRFADLAASNMTLLLSTEGFSYGPYIDQIIARKDPSQIIHLTSGGHRLIEMLIAGRADLALTTEEEALTFAPDGAGGPDYPIIHFADVQTGDARSIMCSRGVPDETIAKLDQAIESTVKP